MLCISPAPYDKCKNKQTALPIKITVSLWHKHTKTFSTAICYSHQLIYVFSAHNTYYQINLMGLPTSFA